MGYSKRLPAPLQRSLLVQYVPALSLEHVTFSYLETLASSSNKASYMKYTRLLVAYPHAQESMKEAMSPQLLMAACEIGDPALAIQFRHLLKWNSNYVRTAMLMQHWDVLDALLPNSRVPDVNLPAMLISIQSVGYFHSRWDEDIGDRIGLWNVVTGNCYRYGYDRELLDYAYAHGMARNDPPQASDLFINPGHLLDDSAPETLTYILSKYSTEVIREKSVGWILNGAICRPSTIAKLKAILHAAGCSD